MSAIVGREAELEQVDRFLTSAAAGTHGLHLHGEAGIGKSTIWQRTLALAAERGFHIVSSRPTEAEARLPLAGLNDLFGGFFDELGGTLPEPQRRALGAALLRADVDDATPEPLAISLAVLTLVRAAAERGPLLMAVDDVPWLDDSSASVLEFLVRRLDVEPVGIAVAERTRSGADPDRRIVGALQSDRVTELHVQPMASVAIDRLLSITLGLDLPPSSLRKLHRVSGGNPFYAVEIGRALQRHGADAADRELPVPETLSELLRERLDALSVPATDVVEHASALSQPRLAQLIALLGEETVDSGVPEAVAANVVAVDDDIIRFTHPLLAAELYRDLPDARRKDLHRRLAGVVTEPEEHARHMALAAQGPDEEVAADLERAAERAYARGAPDAAADLAERSLVATPNPLDRPRRQRVAAGYHIRAGDMTRAQAHLQHALEGSAPGPDRAAVLLRLGEAWMLMGDWHRAEELLDQAVAEAGDDVALEIEIRLQLGGVSNITGRRWQAGARHVAEAWRLAERLGEPRLLARTIGPYATWQSLTGPGYAADLEERAAELEPWTGHLRAMDHPHHDFSGQRWEEGDVAGYQRFQRGLLERAERSGDYSSMPYFLANIARGDLATGGVESADALLDRAERMARSTGHGTALAHVLAARTGFLARTGQEADARRVGGETRDLALSTGWRIGERVVSEELAQLELSRRASDAALDAISRWGVAPAAGESPVTWRSDIHAEALVGVGRIAEARELLEGWERYAPWRTSPNRMRLIRRVRALVEAADGNLEEATSLLDGALATFRRFDHVFERARTELIGGEIHRRARRRGLAREALAQAAHLFESVGSPLWAAHAREELQRIGAPREAGEALTPTQSQVADLVTQGMTNRQVGDRLFMSPHTVEAHLTAIYRALGIRSRAELDGALRTHSAGDSARPTPRDSADDSRDIAPEPDAQT